MSGGVGQRIEANVRVIRDRVAQAAARAGRDPAGILILPVVKNRELDEVRALCDAGFGALAENRAPAALEKMAALDRAVEWHMVGHLQRNKAAKAVGRFALIHSVESMDLVDKLSRRSQDAGVVTRVLVEVNASGEEAKYGVEPGAALDFASRAAEREAVEVLGFMGMGPLYGDQGAVRDAFKRLKEVFDQSAGLDIRGFRNRILSMGMTDDYETAVEEGSTLLRIGRAFFE